MSVVPPLLHETLFAHESDFSRLTEADDRRGLRRETTGLLRIVGGNVTAIHEKYAGHFAAEAHPVDNFKLHI